MSFEYDSKIRWSDAVGSSTVTFWCHDAYGHTKKTYDTRSSRHWKAEATKLLALLLWRPQQHQPHHPPQHWTTTLWLHMEFNLISFTLRPFSKDLFTHTVTARPSAYTGVCVASSSSAWKYNVRSRFIWFALRWLKLLFRYITLTTISCWNECAWIKFEP